MDGITFFLEPERTNVFAAFTANGTFVSRGDIMQEGMGAVYETPNSPVEGTSASAGYLAHCTVIDEPEARQIHPRLFARLDS